MNHPMALEDKHFEMDIYLQNGIPFGVDEVGRGCLAGPVCIGICSIPREIFDNKWHEFRNLGIHDSKCLSAKKREAIVHAVHQMHIPFAVGISSVAEINSLGISRSVTQAIRRGYNALAHKIGSKVNLNYTYLDGSIKPPSCIHNYSVITGGDRTVLSIALASIIAKVVRDKYMYVLHRYHPQYGWGENMGYATNHHRSAIQKYGITNHHRTLYCRNVLGQHRAEKIVGRI